jgi:hypothetical protein
MACGWMAIAISARRFFRPHGPCGQKRARARHEVRGKVPGKNWAYCDVELSCAWQPVKKIKRLLNSTNMAGLLVGTVGILFPVVASCKC